MADYLLFESAVGLALFQVSNAADLNVSTPESTRALKDLSKFGKLVQPVSFSPWASAAQGLECINMISEGLVPDPLKNLLELNLPKTSGKKAKVTLGVADVKLAGEITNIFPAVQCETSTTSSVVDSLLRGVRQHQAKLLKGLNDGDIDRAQLGLGHAYSRSRVKFSEKRHDQAVIQAIATLDALDKGINAGSMRVREWFGWHFPELVRIVPENALYCKLVLLIGDKSTLGEDRLDDVANVLNQDKDRAEAIIGAAKHSMGQEISAGDLAMVSQFATNVSNMADYRRILSESLDKKMGTVAPNLQSILGTSVAARLISHAGSLTTLSKYPASTLQILGAEKALFRALKTKGATPKYGLLYQSSFIGRAGPKIKGRISRFLANKCSIASRIDNFSETPTSRFGEAMRDQIEQRLNFYATGAKPEKNVEVMDKALKALLADGGSMDIDEDEIEHHGAGEDKDDKKEKKKSKKEKKDKEKKDKKRKSLGDIEMADANEDGEHKKRKKRKSLPAEA